MDLPLIMTIEQDLSALNSRPAQVRAVVHRESEVWAPETVEDIRLRSSMKACSLEKDYRKGAASKYSTLLSMPSTCC